MENYHSFNPNYSPYYPPPPGAYPGYQTPPAPNAYSPYPPYGDPYSQVHSPPQQHEFHHSGPLVPLPNSNPHPAPSFHSNSLPTSLNFGYPPNVLQQGSFQYSSESCQHYYHSPPPRHPPEFVHSHQGSNPLAPSSLSHRPLDSPSPPTAPSSQLYPIEDVLASLHLSDNHPTPGTLSTSSSFGGFHRQDSGAARPGIYGYPSYSFSSPSHAPLRGVSQQIVPYSPSRASLKVLLLHGSLDLHIYEASNLPNLDMFSKTLNDIFGRKVANKIDEHMPGQHSITSDPYVSVCVSKAVVARTYVVSNNENPIWNQHFRVPVAHHAAEVQFFVKDSDMIGSQLIGIVSIPAEQIYSGLRVEGSFPILGLNKKPCKSGATLRISLQYIPMEAQTLYNLGVGGPDHKGIPGTYFPLRKGGRVTLYQDAHVPDDSLPTLRLEGDAYYHHGKCWRDIFEAIKHARRLIYITGWSVYHMLRLVRDANNYETLGELLKAKSQEGVRVLLLVWDDPTSRRILGFQTEGIMATHDEETKRFFKHSSVRVLLCPRSAGKRHSWAKQQETGAIYTHHQKSVVLDADAGNGKRKIIAFVGGLDLCDGRYDTPKHSLFRTLQTTHREDYHNPTFPAGVTSPREPWHDLHCRIDGPAAYDVLTNFEERWSKSSKPHVIGKFKRTEDDSLLKLSRIPDILEMAGAPCLDENDPEAWHVQIFRSIDSNSVKGFPEDSRQAMRSNLTCGKNVMIDMSIHTAYVEAIRAAQHFIYIENQYFIGSSYNWSAHNDLGANNLIPMEIALKIANKIKANERFSAYIVIPMWPEGVPTANATQRILYWQHRTMQMMYDTVYKALEEANLEKTYHPRDYLTFFCLGNREVEDGHMTLPPPASPANTPQALAQKNRRFMIYVHSKGMVVDDEYVILGSANINQRSMDGTRDSEIAMGAYQPYHTWARKFSNPHGQIYGYRMSLWAEHLGILDDCFRHPESLGCIRRVNHLAELNWTQFAAEQVTEMQGHLMRYPVEVDSKGKVKALPGCETFPDCGGNILGSFMMVQENLTV